VSSSFLALTLVANRLNGFVYVLAAGSGRFGVCLHLVPEGLESRAPVAVPDVPLDETPYDIARTLSLLAGQRLKVIFQIIVDPYGQLSHDVKGGGVVREAVHSALHAVQRMGSSAVPGGAR